MLKKLAESPDPRIRERAVATIEATARARTVRSALSRSLNVTNAAPATARTKVRRIFDCKGSADLTRKLVREENDRQTSDVAVNEAYDYAGVTWDFTTRCLAAIPSTRVA
ncbi:hypothetical protein ACQ86E_33725 [Bradyrhizobium betae]|uniref:hypothetical protein n=1 Tax=Bradyrhizobium betae TaxID=244734 RepID=UPI003D6777F2